MTDDELRRAYERAFLAQARSDWNVYRLLSESAEPSCHALHYLQMATEKLAKAYRMRETESPVSELVSHHTGFTKFVRQYLLSARNRELYEGKAAQLQSLVNAAAKLAAEIEKLAPAIDRGSSPENVEYPWEAGGRVIAPCEWSFPALSLLKAAHASPELLVTLTGIAELAGALGLLIPRLAPYAGACLALLLVALFPANIHAARAGLSLGGTPVLGVLPRGLIQLVQSVPRAPR